MNSAFTSMLTVLSMLSRTPPSGGRSRSRFASRAYSRTALTRCGPDKPHSKRFRIRRPTQRAADWYCFYCGEHGSLTKEGPVDLEEELKARQSARELEEDQRAAKIGRGLAIWNEALPVQGTAAIE